MSRTPAANPSYTLRCDGGAQDLYASLDDRQTLVAAAFLCDVLVPHQAFAECITIRDDLRVTLESLLFAHKPRTDEERTLLRILPAEREPSSPVAFAEALGGSVRGRANLVNSAQDNARAECPVENPP